MIQPKEPVVFFPFGMGNTMAMRRCDGSYRNLTWCEKFIYQMFDAYPSDVWAEPLTPQQQQEKSEIALLKQHVRLLEQQLREERKTSK